MELRAAIASLFEFTGRSTMVEETEAIIAELRSATIDAYAAGEHPFDTLIFRDTVEEFLFWAVQWRCLPRNCADSFWLRKKQETWEKSFLGTGS
jgi:hypothetical protein